jgi:DNA-binding Lrp family transcriptional regulator
MDSTDLQIIALLSENPLVPYREMAIKLGTSVPAIHRRVEVLRKKGILGGHHASIPLQYLRAVSAHVVGRSLAPSMDDVMRGLSRNDSVQSVLVASGNVLFIHAELRGIDALDEFSAFAKRAAMISEPRIAIDKSHEDEQPIEGDLTPLDLRIIRSLHDDARKNTVKVAEELGVSPRTVRQHLNRMVEDRRIEFMTEFDPTCSEDTSSILRIFLKEDSDKKKVGATIVRKHFPEILYCQSFVNIPDFVICATITKTSKDLKVLLEKVQLEEELRSVESNIALAGRYFRTWRDALVESCDKDRAKEIAEKLAKHR